MFSLKTDFFSQSKRFKRVKGKKIKLKKRCFCFMLLLYVVFCHLVFFVLNYLSSGGRESFCLTLHLVLVVLNYLLSREGGGGGL